MAIQMRRGNFADLDPSRLVAGEFAVSQDNQRVFLCVSAGNVIELIANTPLDEWVEESEAWAVGTKDGVPVEETDVQYHNNSKYYAESIEGDAEAAQESAEDSEAWAVGKRSGTDVPSTDPAYQNNSKFYSDRAASMISSGIATVSRVGLVKPDGSTITIAADGTLSSVSGGGKYLEQTGSNTTYSFTDNAIDSTSRIDPYTDTFGDNPSNITISSHTCTLTFEDAQSRTVGILIN